MRNYNFNGKQRGAKLAPRMNYFRGSLPTNSFFYHGLPCLDFISIPVIKIFLAWEGGDKFNPLASSFSKLKNHVIVWIILIIHDYLLGFNLKITLLRQFVNPPTKDFWCESQNQTSEQKGLTKP